MAVKCVTVEAVFQNGVLRPAKRLPLKTNQRVTLTIEWPASETVWPENTQEIYRELAEEDKRLAEMAWPMIKEAWPIEGDHT